MNDSKTSTILNILNISKIGIFDSGIGGLSIYREIRRLLPYLHVDYFADQAFCPYGNRKIEEIRERCKFITERLLGQGAQMIIVACNTATALAIDYLRQEFPHISFVGVEPFVKYILRLNASEKAHSALILTVGTANSERFLKLKHEYDPDDEITVYPCPELASYIEENIDDLYDETDSRKKDHFIKILREEHIKDIIGKKHSHLILGCTHYPLIKEEIEEITGAQCISAEVFVAKRVEDLLKDNQASKGLIGQFNYTSSSNYRPKSINKIIKTDK